MNNPAIKGHFLRFLREDLAISSEAINLVLGHKELHYGGLSMLLWRYGLINQNQLLKIWDWQDKWGDSVLFES